MTWGPRGLRARIVYAFALGALLVSAVLVTTTFVLARSYLLGQRERAGIQQAVTDARTLASRLSTAGSRVGDELVDVVPSGGADILVASGGAWYSSSLDVGAQDVPVQLQELVAGGTAGSMRVSTPSGPHLVVGVPVAAAELQFYEVAPLTELESSLRTLAAVLGAGAVAATAAGALCGTWASRRVVQPLEQVAGAATMIAGGELSTRLPRTEDPDLLGIVASFNSMVEALSARIERDARFVGDVSHELRSPLTSLTTGVEVLGARREELSDRGRRALTLVESELDRFRQTLDDLLELARTDGAADLEVADRVSLGALVREVLLRRGVPPDVLRADPDAMTAVVGDKNRLERMVTNVLDNADRHAGGVVGVGVRRQDRSVSVVVDDSGPGVTHAERERVFERFVRGPRSARGSLPGAGLGLAIVEEIVVAHGGAAWISDSPTGGARITMALPGAPR